MMKMIKMMMKMMMRKTMDIKQTIFYMQSMSKAHIVIEQVMNNYINFIYCDFCF